MRTSHTRNINGLLASAQLRAEQTQQRVDQVLSRLIQEQKPINFNAVATAAGVTKAYLYSKPLLRERIEALRQQHTLSQPRSAPSTSRTDASKDLLLAAKDRRIKQLEEENQRLQRNLKGALGKHYEHL